MKKKLYDYILFQSKLPVLKLEMNFPFKEIYKEIKNLNMVPQINNNKWLGCALRGLEDNKPRPYYEYGYSSDLEVPYRWTKNSKSCEVTKNFIEKQFEGCKLFRVKVQSLLPGGRIHLHNDSVQSALGLSDKSSDPDSTFLSLAINWPKEIIFNIDNKNIPIKSGDAYLFNFSKNHEVFNPTKFERFSLLITGLFHNSDTWQSLVIDSYKKNKNIKFGKATSTEVNDQYLQGG